MADSKRAHCVLVLQGGGALGSYQGGVFEALVEAGIEPTWMTGISIGAINCALVAGNAPDHRVARLREFWERVTSSLPEPPYSARGTQRVALNELSATNAMLFGVPGFFRPWVRPHRSSCRARGRRSAGTTPSRCAARSSASSTSTG
jgi:NTE family protein